MCLMALIEIDHLVRSTGLAIIILFLHSYLMAEKGTEYDLSKENEDEDCILTTGITEETGLKQQ
jgi:hypothetical protein